MKNKILIFVIAVLVPLVIISFKKSETNFNLNKKKEKTLIIKDTKNNNELKQLNLEDYVIGVIAAEMPASFEKEALKAQAVASRTYAMYKLNHRDKEYDLVTDVSDQSYISLEQMKTKWQEDFTEYYQKIKTAVAETKDQVLTYNNEIIIAYYFAMSNGYTEDASLVFNEAKDYLVSEESKWDNENLKNYEYETQYKKEYFCQKLEINCEKIEIESIKRSSTHRVNEITINKKTFLGTKFRKLLNLRSTDFEISFLDDQIQIVTYGYGHGVGMSQYGANGMAKDGYNYQQILTYYYKNVEVGKI